MYRRTIIVSTALALVAPLGGCSLLGLTADSPSAAAQARLISEGPDGSRTVALDALDLQLTLTADAEVLEQKATGARVGWTEQTDTYAVEHSVRIIEATSPSESVDEAVERMRSGHLAFEVLSTDEYADGYAFRYRFYNKRSHGWHKGFYGRRAVGGGTFACASQGAEAALDMAESICVSMAPVSATKLASIE